MWSRFFLIYEVSFTCNVLLWFIIYEFSLESTRESEKRESSGEAGGSKRDDLNATQVQMEVDPNEPEKVKEKVKKSKVAETKKEGSNKQGTSKDSGTTKTD